MKHLGGMPKLADLPETMIGEAVCDYLTRDNWEVFQEVSEGTGGRRADIVARRGKILWIIECKKSVGLEVLDQLVHWERAGLAHYYSAAVFAPRVRSDALHMYYAQHLPNKALNFLFDHFGFGLLTLRPDSKVLHVCRAPSLHRVDRFPWPKIDAQLHEEQKTQVKAGSVAGNYSTPFKRTVEGLQKLIAKHGKLPIKEAIEQLDHHYQTESSARSSLAHWAAKGGIPGVRLKKEGRALYFAPGKGAARV